MSEYRVGSLAHANAEKSYTPKVGDKVRATLGESVLVGDVTYANRYVGTDDGVVDVTLREGARVVEMSIGTEDGWLFEQVVSVPSKFGAVIRRADGEVLILARPNAEDDREWLGVDTGWRLRSTATRGGFTVLFDGVDE